jgi:hypothetical protein
MCDEADRKVVCTFAIAIVSGGDVGKRHGKVA